MSFVETRLAECAAYGFQTIPAYSTQIVALDNGKEQRNINITRAKRRFVASYSTFEADAFAALLDCFHAVGGSGLAFRFRDHTDYQATLESLGTTPGANQTPVQLYKTYTFGAQSRTRTIVKPNSDVVVYQNGIAKAGSLDTATGLFTPTTNWTAGAALTWTGTFDVPVRFASDEMPASIADLNNIVAECELLEVFL